MLSHARYLYMYVYFFMNLTIFVLLICELRVSSRLLHLWFTLPGQSPLLLRLSQKQQSLLQQQRLLQLQLLQQQHPNLQLPALLRQHQRRRRNRHRQ